MSPLYSRLTLEEYGPGWWEFIIQAAVRAKDPSTLAFFNQVIGFTAAAFTCQDCRNHFNVLIHQIRPSDYQNYNDIDGNSPVKYVWLLKNNVNVRIHKPVMPWLEFKVLYLTPAAGPAAPGECQQCSLTGAPHTGAQPPQGTPHGWSQPGQSQQVRPGWSNPQYNRSTNPHGY